MFLPKTGKTLAVPKFLLDSDWKPFSHIKINIKQ
jgi:hypothetical protein